MVFPVDTGSYLSDFSNIEESISSNGLSWLRDIRRIAIDHFAQSGFPTTKDEEWKYTNVASIVNTTFHRATALPQIITNDQLRESLGYDCLPLELVFINGRCSHELSNSGSISSGVSLRSMANALEEDRVIVEPYYAKIARSQSHPFTALNTAFMEDGGFIRIGNGVVVEQPIHLLYATLPFQSPAICYPRNLIVVGDNSSVTIVESFIGLEDGIYWNNVVTEVVLGENSVVEYLRFQRESEQAFHIATLQVDQRRSSSLNVQSFSAGSSISRDNINVILGGEGGTCTLNGLFLVSGRQHADIHTKIDHAMPYCTSSEIYKGILDDQSTGVFNGKIVVRQVAQKTDAKQTNNNLLLSEKAEINSKPQLEILANDVKCSHGSTVGPLAEEEMFYLKSRGLDQMAARELLTYAFARDLMDNVKFSSIRLNLENLLFRKFR